MNKTIYAKNYKAENGAEFKKYFTTMTNTETGNEEVVEVKFKKTTTPPAATPAIIEFDKADASMQTKEYEGRTYYTMWISKYTEHEYKDYSMAIWE